MISEKEYIQKVSLSHRKEFAQFFTPEQIADFMVEWVLRGTPEKPSFLEPAFGLGVFSRAIKKNCPSASIIGYDIDKTIYDIAVHNNSELQCDINLRNEDYLTSSWEDKYDGIVCNPPYLKFHDYDNAKLVPYVNQELGIRLNRFTNLYTLFLLKSISQLKEGGRLAYIIPSEFLNSDYGVEVKRFLLDSGTLRYIVIVDFTQCAFEDALTTACIVFCEKSTHMKEIKFSNIDDISKLNLSLSDYKSINVELLDPNIKWKQYYENTQSAKYNGLVPFSLFAKVSRGIATGANSFFTFNASKKDTYNLADNCFHPCICHSADVTSQIFTESEFARLVSADKTVFLFNGCSDEDNPNVKNYLRYGIEKKVHEKYLTASRTPWYSLENRKPSPIWVSVFNRNGLRFVRNKAGVYNLTTFHCVYSNDLVDTDILFSYLITDLAKEIFLDNSRQYGNGLVKFEPNDLNEGKVVDLRKLTDEERTFLLAVYEKIQYYGMLTGQFVGLLDDFYREKYSGGHIELQSFYCRLRTIGVNQSIEIDSEKAVVQKRKIVHIKQYNFWDLFDQYGENNIVENALCETSIQMSDRNHQNLLDRSQNVLISLVKKDNEKAYVNNTATIYYTGKKFPSTIELNKLYYFMPYLKGKGVRDLWLIKIVRLGYRKEGQSNEDKNDIRLVFELEFVKQLFDEYKPVELKIWQTFNSLRLDELKLD